MKRKVNRWEEYCETTYNSLKANVHNWGKPEFFRPLTRIYYMGVFDCGNPNHTRLISETAFDRKRRSAKTVHDHYLSPQFVGRMILDHPDQYLTVLPGVPYVQHPGTQSVFSHNCDSLLSTCYLLLLITFHQSE